MNITKCVRVSALLSLLLLSGACGPKQSETQRPYYAPRAAANAETAKQPAVSNEEAAAPPAGEGAAENSGDSTASIPGQPPVSVPPVKDSAPAEVPPVAAPPVVVPAPAPAPVAFALTSSAFKNQEPIPELYVAKDNGGNQSIPLEWTGAPEGAASFAIQMVDNNNALIHWLITNIPATSKSLPAAIRGGNALRAPAEALGANQPTAYRGPNPPNLHRYELTIYAIKAGVTLNLGRNSANNAKELEGKSLGKASIIGTYE